MRTYHEHEDMGQPARLRGAALSRLVEGLVYAAQPGIRGLRGPAGLLSLRGACRGPAPVAALRQRAMYLAHVAGGLSLTAVGRAFGRDRTTVRHACALWEESRDDRLADHLLNVQEAAFAAMAERLGLIAGKA